MLDFLLLALPIPALRALALLLLAPLVLALPVLALALLLLLDFPDLALLAPHRASLSVG